MCPSVFEVGRGVPARHGAANQRGTTWRYLSPATSTGGLDIQKLRDWEVDEKHVVLYDNIVALGAGSDSW